MKIELHDSSRLRYNKPAESFAHRSRFADDLAGEQLAQEFDIAIEKFKKVAALPLGLPFVNCL